MEHTWRWFGPEDPVGLADVVQTGATGVVTALHDIPNGQVWPVEAIVERRRLVESHGLTWSVVESVPVHEDVKLGLPGCGRYVSAYAETLRNLAACGIDVVCYNFMPVLDWTRTDLSHRLPDGSRALRFDQVSFAAFDLHLLRRPGAEAEYTAGERHLARERYQELGVTGRETLERTILAGLPGAEEHYTMESFREAIAAYREIGAPELRENLRAFLVAVAPVAEEAGVRLAIHPDDPPWPLLGLPRVLSTAEDVEWLLRSVNSPANGLTLCTGSFGANPSNDVVAMARRFADRIYFAHLRSTRTEADGRSFHEAGHLSGDVDMVAVVRELVLEERRRAAEGGPRLPMRPDHGREMLDDLVRRTNPGYPLIGRLTGLAELRGVELAVRWSLDR